MKDSQAEIRAIQEKLRAIKAEKPSSRNSASIAQMVELFPSGTGVSVAPSSPDMVEGGRPDSSRPATTILPTTDVEAAFNRHPKTTLNPPRSAPDASKVSSNSVQATPGSVNPPRSKATYPALNGVRVTDRSEATRRRIAEESLKDFLQQIEDKAEQINQLSVAQEAAMKDLKQLAEKLERDRKAYLLQDKLDSDEYSELPVCEYEATAVPFVERDEDGAFVIKTRAIDLFQAEREAAFMAQSLRRRAGRSHLNHSGGIGLATLQRIGAQLGQLLQRPQTIRTTPARTRKLVRAAEPISIKQLLVWFAGAIFMRIAIDLMLVSYPGFWIPALAIIVAPAVFAVYRTTVNPQSSVSWGYRLLAIMMGLLIGGRL